jgi:hypothetical protein
LGALQRLDRILVDRPRRVPVGDEALSRASCESEYAT